MKNFSLSSLIIGAAFKIWKVLGEGFLEKVYKNSLSHELSKMDLKVEKEKKIKVHYDGLCVGEYYADLIVDNTIIVELKTVSEISMRHINQVRNYLKATGIDCGLILNFSGYKVNVRRVFPNSK